MADGSRILGHAGAVESGGGADDARFLDDLETIDPELALRGVHQKTGQRPRGSQCGRVGENLRAFPLEGGGYSDHPGPGYSIGLSPEDGTARRIISRVGGLETSAPNSVRVSLPTETQLTDSTRQLLGPDIGDAIAKVIVKHWKPDRARWSIGDYIDLQNRSKGEVEVRSQRAAPICGGRGVVHWHVDSVGDKPMEVAAADIVAMAPRTDLLRVAPRLGSSDSVAGGARSAERSAHCVGGDARVDRYQRICGASTPVFCGSVEPQNCSRKTVAGSTRAGRTGTVRSIAASTPGRWQNVWLDVCVDELKHWFGAASTPDGGWNCEWTEGSTRSSFHLDAQSLKGLLAYEIATGERMRRARLGDPVRSTCCSAVCSGDSRPANRWGPGSGRFAYPFRWRYNVLNAADYFREASLSYGNEPDPRMADAIEMIRVARAFGWDVAPGRSPTGAGVVRGRHKGGRAVEVADCVRHPSARLVGSILLLGPNNARRSSMSMEMVLAEAVIDSGDTAWVLISAGLVLFMSSQTRLLLRRSAEPRPNWTRLDYLGRVRIQLRVQWRLGFRFLGDLKLFGLQDIHTAAAPGFHLIEDDVRDHHARADHRCDRKPAQAPGLGRSARAVVDHRLPPIAHWLFNPEGWLSPAELRTGPAELSSTHPPAPPPWQSCWWSANVRDGPNAEAVPHSVPLALIGAGILWFWLVRIQRRRRIGRRWCCGTSLDEHSRRRSGRHGQSGSSSKGTTEGKATAIGGITGAVAGLGRPSPLRRLPSAPSRVGDRRACRTGLPLVLALKSIFKFDDALDVIAVHFNRRHPRSTSSRFVRRKGDQSRSAATDSSSAAAQDYSASRRWRWIVVIAFVRGDLADRHGYREDHRSQAGSERPGGHRPSSTEAWTRTATTPHSVDAGGAPQTSGFDLGGPGRGQNLFRNLGALKHELITAGLQTIESEKLREALLAAGAESIVVSEAHASASDSASQFRGQRNDVVFTERLRVEVLVASEHAQAVLDAINEYSGGRRSGS
ncbi:unnamed protein product, partial [Mesorhabditis spiculigera]